jgi:hypothetical protein
MEEHELCVSGDEMTQGPGAHTFIKGVIVFLQVFGRRSSCWLTLSPRGNNISFARIPKDWPSSRQEINPAFRDSPKDRGPGVEAFFVNRTTWCLGIFQKLKEVGFEIFISASKERERAGI